jgi:hypothetical protein
MEPSISTHPVVLNAIRGEKGQTGGEFTARQGSPLFRTVRTIPSAGVRSAIKVMLGASIVALRMS